MAPSIPPVSLSRSSRARQRDDDYYVRSASGSRTLYYSSTVCGESGFFTGIKNSLSFALSFFSFPLFYSPTSIRLLDRFGIASAFNISTKSERRVNKSDGARDICQEARESDCKVRMFKYHEKETEKMVAAAAEEIRMYMPAGKGYKREQRLVTG